MSKFEIKSLGADSRHKGRISKGCMQCAKGRKMVLFITGKCNFHCFYCPISEKRGNKDNIYANERPITDDNRGISEMLEEAKLINALGTGITGGDPIKVLPRTVKYIKILKKEFGSKHHIHLYTATPVNEKQIKLLDDAGLDELRLHILPEFWNNFERSKYRDSILALQKSNILPAVEIPLMPDKKKELKNLIFSLDEIGLPFINLNELEISETNVSGLEECGYVCGKNSLVGVEGSRKVGMEMLKLPVKIGINVCTSTYKDSVQLRNRLLERAKNVARNFEIITGDGTILRGIIETQNPEETAETLEKDFGLKKEEYSINLGKQRIELVPELAEEIAEKTNLKCFIVENYPTYDEVEVERIPLGKYKTEDNCFQ